MGEGVYRFDSQVFCMAMEALPTEWLKEACDIISEELAERRARRDAKAHLN